MIQTQFIRQVAVPIMIKDALSATLVMQESQEPTYIITRGGEKLFRLSIIAIVVQKESLGNITNLLVDDGSGQMQVRCFEQNSTLENVNVADAVLLIGKMRSYNQELYFSLEIIAKQDQKWVEVRQQQLGKKEKEGKKVAQETTGHEASEVIEQELEHKQEEVSQTPQNDELVMLPNEKLLSIIKNLDEGQGVLIEDIVEQSPLPNSQQILEKMLEDGEIFQNQPGRVKVL